MNQTCHFLHIYVFLETMDNLVGEYKSLEEQDKTDSQQAGDNGYYWEF